MKEEIIKRIIEHHAHACEKHPVFCKGFANERMSAENLEQTLFFARKLSPTAANILNEEYLEIFEAYVKGDKEHAIDECYDAIAVLVRMVEFIEGEINKDKADKVMDAMEARIKELESQLPKWISVKDRLPCEDGEYQVVYKHKNGAMVASFDEWDNDCQDWMNATDRASVVAWAELLPTPTTEDLK
ncbi:MAG: hypothetical protein MJZ26_11360 [Fibrobacter sp.]|nr:hypothetical protein [Fibrobacter sp.]